MKINFSQTFKKIKQNKKVITLFFAFFLTLFLSTHFHKQDIWPFGQGYYATLKNMDFNYKEILTEEARKSETSSVKKTQIHNIHIDDLKFSFDHIAILSQSNLENIELIAISGNIPDGHDLNSIPLKIYKINLDLVHKKKIIKLLYTIKKNHRATDVLITDKINILISYLTANEKGFKAKKIIKLTHKDNIFSAETIYQGEFSSKLSWPTHVSGGKMIQLDDDHILLTSGEHGNPNLYNDFGKILLINYKNSSNVREIFSKGVRVPQGLTFSKTLNKIIETEHGPQGGDEINEILKGEDYGWPNVSYGIMPYGSDPELLSSNPQWEQFGQHELYKKPIFTYIPSIGIKAIEQLPISQNEFPKWKDNFLICSSDGIFRLEIINNKGVTRVIFTEKLPIKGCRDLQILENGIIITNTGLVISRGPVIFKD